MRNKVFAHFLPGLFEQSESKGGIVVVIDVIRASTTITYALANGAKYVLPCEEIAEAQNAMLQFRRDDVILAGERGGMIIQGFDKGNSPSEYDSKTVNGKIIVFTTSHGTKALASVKTADRILVGSFANLNAVVNLLQETNKDVHLVCSGTDGFPSLEDIICAGVITLGLLSSDKFLIGKSDQALIALAIAQ